MARIEACVDIHAPVERVWDVLVDWEGQPRWMVDARRVTVLSPHREGLNVLVRCLTGLKPPLVVADDMITTEWYEHSTIGVRHLGKLIRGYGAFDLEPVPTGTRFVWWEEVDPPLGLIGEAVTSMLIVPLVNRLFQASLARLKALCEAE
jgi:hypothetical protein